MHLSLLLEQHFLLDSHIPLSFPRPHLPSPSPSVPISPSIERTKSSHGRRSSFIPSGIFSFFSKGGIPRSSTISPVIGHSQQKSGAPVPTEQERTPRSSLDLGIRRLRRLSLKGDKRSPKRKASVEDWSPPFTAILKKVKNNQGLLSTSSGVLFSPPKLLSELAKAEEETQPHRIKGDQKTGLNSLLGWNGKEDLGKGMSGTLGFLRHQEFSVLVARHVPSHHVDSPESEVPIPSGSESPSSSITSSSVSASSIQAVKPHEFIVCGQPRWKTYRYYSADVEDDLTVGEAIWDFVWASDRSCEQPGCHSKQGDHELRLIHGGVNIAVELNSDDGNEERPIEEDRIDMWESCKVCEVKSERHEMSVGT